MEYEIGSLADLITGTVTPNRPKLSRKAFTPVKHKSSPNVTPRGSEALVDNDSFISPSVQKRKNIVKKSPKRIFENINGDLDSTQTESVNEFVEKTKLNLNAAIDGSSPKLKSKGENDTKIKVVGEHETTESNIRNNKRSSIVRTTEHLITDSNTKTPKEKKKRKSDHNGSRLENTEKDDEISSPSNEKKLKNNLSVNDIEEDFKMNTIKEANIESVIKSPKKKNKVKSDQTSKSSNGIESGANSQEDSKLTTTIGTNPKIKSKKKQKPNTSEGISVPVGNTGEDKELSNKTDKKSKTEGRAAKRRARKIAALKKLSEKGIVTTKKKKCSVKSKSLDIGGSSSEHESDDELESETELEVKNILNNTDRLDESSDEDNDGTTKKEETPEVDNELKVSDKDEVSGEKEEQIEEDNKEKAEEVKKPKEHVIDETEAKRTLFVGNVPYSSKCKKELKKIFSPYGTIDTIRFRTIPTKDARITPKLAVIKEEFHPDRDTVVNAYVKFRDMAHATLALAANNTKMGDFHIRVTRSEMSDVTRDSRAVLFVGNLPFDCEEEQLRSAFEKCGAIESVRIVRDRKTQIGKGFGYVNFESADGVELALSLSEDELKVKNRNVRIRRYLVAGSKKKNQNRPINSSGPPNNRFGGANNQSRPPNRFGGQNNHTGAPNNRFGGPNNQSGPPNRFGGQNNRSGPPNNHFGNRNYQFGGNERPTEPNPEVGEKKPTGAALRIQNKTQRSQGAMKRQRENDAGQSPKRPPRDTPRDKKPAKEYLGVTAEKKKKKRISKTDKRKKKLSEILVK